MAATTPDLGGEGKPGMPGDRHTLLRWQALGAVGLLTIALSVYYFRYLVNESPDISRWPPFNWLTLAFLIILSLWAGPGIVKLIVSYIRHRAAIKLDADDKPPKHRRITWFEWQMIDASWVGIIVLAVLLNGLGLTVGVCALAVCKEQRARKKAAVLAALGGVITAVGIISAISKLQG
ncbi:MAG TPA: hypothetical protein PK280_01730 [Planctomycetota bacterium]|nr:hypothetical protein [Planctomycetota bacterium]